MSIQYDENGLVIQNLSEILDERQNECRNFLGNDFVVAGESVVGNLQTVDMSRELDIQEALLYLATQLDPDQAEGIWLDYICSLNNITRYTATKSTIPIKVIGTANTAKNAGDLVIVDNNTDEYYINNDAFSLDNTGVAYIECEATSYGAITALSTSTFSLKTPSVGISSVQYNTNGTAIVGRETETDDELRLRRKDAITYTASSILSSIRANVSLISGVTYLNAYENDTSNVVDTLPAKSFEIVVEGGNDDNIATAILAKKPAGIQAYGTTIKQLSDDDGNVFNIGFTRPTHIDLDITVTFISDSVQTDTWKDALKTELVQAFNSLYNVGDDVYIYNLYYILNNHPEITNVTNFKVKKHTDSTYTDSVVIDKRELATLSTTNITITQG